MASLATTAAQAETLLHSHERAAAGIGLQVNAQKTEYRCFNQTGDISTLNSSSKKLVDMFPYQGSRVSSNETDINTWLAKAWTAIDRLSVTWKSDMTDKMKRSFFQAAVVLILRYGCTTWTLTKRMEKKLDGNYARMLQIILNKSWRQHPTKQQLYSHLPPTTKTIKVRRNTDGKVGTSSWVIYSSGSLHMDVQRQDDQLEPTYSSSVPIRDVGLRTCRKQWTIGRGGERRSAISMLIARHDDDVHSFMRSSLLFVRDVHIGVFLSSSWKEQNKMRTDWFTIFQFSSNTFPISLTEEVCNISMLAWYVVAKTRVIFKTCVCLHAWGLPLNCQCFGYCTLKGCNSISIYLGTESWEYWMHAYLNEYKTN